MDNDKVSSQEFAELEQRLRDGLQHVPAPQGFEARVMARVHQRQAARTAKKSRSSWLAGAQKHSAWWQVAAAALVMAVGGDVMYLHHLREQREAAAAQAQVDRALQLTSHALDQVQDGLDRSPAGRFTKVLLETGK